MKEEIFRDFECFIDQDSDIEVFHEWELFFGHHNLTLVFLDPRNSIISQHTLTINNTKSDEETIKQLFRVPPFPKPITAGLWKLIVVNQMEVIGAFKYEIAQSAQLSKLSSRTFSAETASSAAGRQAYLTNVVNAFVREQTTFFIKQTSSWNIHAVCFKASADLHDYSFQCNNSFEILACSDVSWSLGAVKSRYLLGSQ